MKLDEVRTHMHSFLFTDNIRRAGVLNPMPIMEKQERDDCWGSDPVPPKQALFKKLADMAWIRLLREATLQKGQEAERGHGDTSLGSFRSGDYLGWRGRGRGRGGYGGDAHRAPRRMDQGEWQAEMAPTRTTTC